MEFCKFALNARRPTPYHLSRTNLSSGASPVLTTLNKTRILANIDSGTSLATLNQFYWNAIYKDVPGLQFVQNISSYILPCETKLNVSFIFRYVSFALIFQHDLLPFCLAASNYRFILLT